MFIANNSIFESIMQYFLARSIALKECYLMTNFEKIHCTVFKISVKCKFDGQTLTKCDFFGRSVTQIFFQEICFSGGKQTIHKVSAAFIVKNQKSFILFHTGLLETFSPEGHPP